VLGFLGPNGAGKTTTIRLLLDLIRPTGGEARLFGQPVSDPAVRQRIGYLPGELSLDERLTGRRMLAFFDDLRPAGCPPADARRRDELCERLRLTSADLARVIRDNSRGTKQKIGFVAAFQHDPELLVLDEPTTGLDPLVRESALELMREAGAAGRTVFHSSHVISEVDRSCTRVAIVRAGRLVTVERIDALRKTLTRRMVVRFAGEVPIQELDVPGAELLEHGDGRAVILVSGELDPLLQVLARHPVQHMAFPEPELDEAFLHLYGAEDASP
jgi:ABC-2 type transport system ATP-binding protein